jgi:hypothetical protein
MVSESIWRRFDKLSVTNQLPTLGVLCLTVNPLQSIAQEPSLKVNLWPLLRSIDATERLFENKFAANIIFELLAKLFLEELPKI